jgi:hypothetical protein
MTLQTPSLPAPFLALLHATQVPVQAVLQQTLSTQLPLVHWFAVAQAAPSASFALQKPKLQ